MTIIATLKRDWEMLDGSVTRGRVNVVAGDYELERIPNPYGHKGTWLVIKGTKIGMAEGAWKDWQNGTLNASNKPIDWGDAEIIIKEN